MRISRFFVDMNLDNNIQISVSGELQHYLIKVLRLKLGRYVYLFNGKTHYDYLSKITNITKEKITIEITNEIENKTESLLKIHLGQALSKTDKFDMVVQKATELGVTSITPVITEHCEYKNYKSKASKLIARWKNIAKNATEQSGRSNIPIINDAILFEKWIEFGNENSVSLILNPYSDISLKQLNLSVENKEYYLSIGSEGGFSSKEIELSKSKNIIGINLGKRILRTETAPLSIISILQYVYE